MQTLEHTSHGWHLAQTAHYQSDFGDAGGSALTRGLAHARVGHVIAPSATSLPHSSWSPARSAERWSCPWSGRWRTCTREAALPHAHAPARPRSRVDRARTWVRAPPKVLPDAVVNRARDKLRAGSIFFSQPSGIRCSTVGHGLLESASQGAQQKTH